MLKKYRLTAAHKKVLTDYYEGDSTQREVADTIGTHRHMVSRISDSLLKTAVQKGLINIKNLLKLY